MKNSQPHFRGLMDQRATFPIKLDFIFMMVCCLVLPFLTAHAQGGPTVTSEQPVPLLKFIPDEDRTRLAQENDNLKDRTRFSLELADSRLRRAAELTAIEQYEAAAKELGVYHALIEDVMSFLKSKSEIKNGKASNKTRDLYKRVDLALRAHGPRLETIRRSTPAEEAFNVREVYEYTRQARAEALESFYGATVLREETTPKPAGEFNKELDPNLPPSP